MLLVTFAERAFLKKLLVNGHANTRRMQCSLSESYLAVDVGKEVKGRRWESVYFKTLFQSVGIQYLNLPSRQL